MKMIFSVLVFALLLSAANVANSQYQLYAQTAPLQYTDSANCLNYQGKHYCFVQEPMNYSSADLHCKSLNMAMVKIDSPELNAWLFTNSDAQNGHVWIGLNDLKNESLFVWVDGSEPRLYTNWNESQPDDSRQNEDCVHLKTNGKWNDLPCYLKLKFVCERKSIDGGFSDWSSWGTCGKTCGEANRMRSRTCDSPAPQFGGRKCQGELSVTESCNLPNCPVDGGFSLWASWSSCQKACGTENRTRARYCNEPEPKYGGKLCQGLLSETELCDLPDCPAPANSACQSYKGRTFHFVQTKVNYDDAVAGCLRSDMKLIRIEDAEMNNWMITYLSKYGNQMYWIGLNDKASEGNFKWENGQYLSYSNWAGGEPNGGQSENCALAYTNGLWNDGACSTALYYICENAAGTC